MAGGQTTGPVPRGAQLRLPAYSMQSHAPMLSACTASSKELRPATQVNGISNRNSIYHLTLALRGMRRLIQTLHNKYFVCIVH